MSGSLTSNDQGYSSNGELDWNRVLGDTTNWANNFRQARDAWRQDSSARNQSVANARSGLQNFTSQSSVLGGWDEGGLQNLNSQFGAFRNNLNINTSAPIPQELRNLYNQNPLRSIREDLRTAAGGANDVMRNGRNSPNGGIEFKIDDWDELNDESRWGSFDASGLNELGGQISAFQNSLNDNLARQRNERQRVEGLSSNYSNQLNSLQSSLSGIGIEEESRINSARSQAEGLRDQIASLSSPLSFQRPDASGALSGVSELIGRRTAEQNRINEYGAALRNDLAGFRSQANAFGIRDIDRVRTLDSEAEARAAEARGFTSKLGFNFEQSLGGFGEIDGILERLKAARANEETRIATNLGAFTQDARSLSQSIPGVDFRAGNALDAERARLAALDRSINGFTSELHFSLDGVNAERQRADNSLRLLTELRGSTLQSLRDRAAPVTEGLQEVDLWNEGEIRRRLGLAESVRNDLNSFTGNDLAQTREAIDSARTAANTRLQDLFNRRTDIEQRTGSQLTQVREANLARQSDLTPLDELLASLTAEADQYNSSQSSDELSALRTLLQNERSRLQTDENNVRLREMQARAAMQGGSTNELSWEAELNARPLANGSMFRRRQLGGGTPAFAQSPFARALGIEVG